MNEKPWWKSRKMFSLIPVTFIYLMVNFLLYGLALKLQSESIGSQIVFLFYGYLGYWAAVLGMSLGGKVAHQFHERKGGKEQSYD